MYISNEKELVQRLKENNLTEWEVVQQYLAMMLMYIAGIGERGQLWKESEKTWPGIIIAAAALICGTLYCYNVNKNGDNKDFIKRIVCLAFPVAFNWALIIVILLIGFGFPIFMLLTYKWPNFSLQHTVEQNPMLLVLAPAVFNIIYLTIYYWRLGKQIYKVSH